MRLHRVIATAVAVSFLAACGSASDATVDAAPAESIVTANQGVRGDGEQTFLATGESSAALIRWTENDGALAGTYNFTEADPSRPAGTKTREVSFIGLRNGDNVSLTMSLGLGEYQTLTGRLDGGALHLSSTQQDGQLTSDAYREADADAYNRAVAQLASTGRIVAQEQAEYAAAQATAAQEARAQQQADQAVLNAETAFANALADIESSVAEVASDSKLSDPLKDMAEHLTELKADMGDVRSPASDATCYDLEQAAYTIEQDLYTMEQDDYVLDTDVELLGDFLDRLKTSIADAATALSALQAAREANPTGEKGSLSNADLDEAKHSATAARTAATKAINAAEGKSKKLYASGQALLDEANQIAKSCQGDE